MRSKVAVLGNAPIFSELLPLVRPTLPGYESLAPKFSKIIDSGMVTRGQFLQEFEQRLASYMNTRHALCVSSCTLGLMLTYQGLGLTGEVIVPSFTFMATVHPIVWNQATPVFVDIDPETLNIDPASVSKAITSRTTGIVAVHNFGNPASVCELEEIARANRLKLVFDAAHGFGSMYRGKRVGAFGDAEVFSLSPTKLLVSGEGGVVATNNDELAEHVRKGREYGNPGNYSSEFAGLNARLSEFHAVLGIGSLEMLETNTSRRNELASEFKARLGIIPGLTFQFVHPEDRSSYKDFVIVVGEREFGLDRDQLALALRAENIDSRKYHWPPVHMHEPYIGVCAGCSDSLPVTDRMARKALTLPLWSHMDMKTIEGICQAVGQIQHNAEEVRQALAAPAASRRVL